MTKNLANIIPVTFQHMPALVSKLELTMFTVNNPYFLGGGGGGGGALVEQLLHILDWIFLYIMKQNSVIFFDLV